MDKICKKALLKRAFFYFPCHGIGSLALTYKTFSMAQSKIKTGLFTFS